MKDELLSTSAHPRPPREGSAMAGTGERPTPAPKHPPEDPLLSARGAAAEACLSLPAFWRGVADGRLPAPVYPAPRAPRWYRSELREAIRATRALPAEAKAARRAAKHARDAAP